VTDITSHAATAALFPKQLLEPLPRRPLIEESAAQRRGIELHRAPKMTFRGGSLTHCEPSLTADGKHVLVVAGNDVRLYSAVSGDQLSTLSGHTAAITAVVLDPKDAAQVGAGRDGADEPQSCRHRWAHRSARGTLARGTAGGGERRQWSCAVCCPASPASRGNASRRCMSSVLEQPPLPTQPATLQVYTASRDETVKLWNFRSGEMLRSYTINAPIEGFVSGCCYLWPSPGLHAGLLKPSRSLMDAGIGPPHASAWRFSRLPSWLRP
jgi:hypothetical protein